MSVEQQNTSEGVRAAVDWSRTQWLGYADRLLDAARAHASVNNARITFPGPEGGYGRAVDGLEGFARTFLLAGFRLAGDRGVGLESLADFYRRGITAGVDPEAEDRWVRLDEHAQAKVEAASLAVALDMTRPWIWDQLSAITQQRVIEYLSPVVGDDTYPKTNWLWFRVVVQTFLRSVGGPWSRSDIAADLALHDSLARSDGWISDGFERSYDHYVGWALHVYPVLWSRMHGAEELAAGRTVSDVAKLDRFLQDAIALVGADGSPLLQGRSLIYRFAAAAPFWVGAIARVPSVPLGQLRLAASAIIEHFDANGVPDQRGILTMGWHDEWRDLAQSYSGPGSPYWAVKGLMGIALPADHPVWAAPPVPLPIVSGDTLRVVRAAGWVVSGTQGDGIVRIVNHGTDHAEEGSLVGDSPLYARIGYSTATSPLVDRLSWEQPFEQSVGLVDVHGRATHRAAMELIDVRVQDDDGGRVGIAASRTRAHWIAPRPSAQRHGSGVEGDIERAGVITVHSLVRGAWELRLTHLDALEPGLDASTLRLTVSGWPIAGAAVAQQVSARAASVAARGIHSSIGSVLGDGTCSVTTRRDASPLGPEAVTPFVEYPAAVGVWVATILELAGGGLRTPLHAAVAIDTVADATTVTVTWPDSLATTSRLSPPGFAAARTGSPMGPEDGIPEFTKE